MSDEDDVRDVLAAFLAERQASVRAAIEAAMLAETPTMPGPCVGPFRAEDFYAELPVLQDAVREERLRLYQENGLFEVDGLWFKLREPPPRPLTDFRSRGAWRWPWQAENETPQIPTRKTP